MNIFIITLKKIAIFTICFIICVLVIFLGIKGTKNTVETGNKKKINPICFVDREDKVVSLSFDTAWKDEQTKEILKILDEYDIKTTFFLTGDWIDKYRDSATDIHKAGHDIGNHASKHQHMTALYKDEIKLEISACNEKIQEITGSQPTLFRAPYGDYNNTILNLIKDLEMHTIQWNIDGFDWKDRSAEKTANKIISKLQPGSIILLHNGSKFTPKALPLIIEGIQSEGYKIIPISEMIFKTSYHTDRNGKQIQD